MALSMQNAPPSTKSEIAAADAAILSAGAPLITIATKLLLPEIAQHSASHPMMCRNIFTPATPTS